MSKQEVANTKENPVANIDINMFVQDAGKGLSAITQEDLALPFLKILSGLDDMPEGAKKGDIINTVTGQIYPGAEGVRVILAMFNKRFIHWEARGTGSGAPKAIYAPGEMGIPKTERSSEDNKDYVTGGNGDYLDTTAQHYVVVLNEDGYDTALISMKSTQLKKSKKWLSMVMSRNMKDDKGVPFTPPSYAYVYSLKTVSEENSKGKWHGWDITLEQENSGVLQDAEAYHKARAFADSIQKGEITVKHTSDAPVADAEDGRDEDLPF
mgnify:CR=1 FL=1